MTRITAVHILAHFSVCKLNSLGCWSRICCGWCWYRSDEDWRALFDTLYEDEANAEAVVARPIDLYATAASDGVKVDSGVKVDAAVETPITPASPCETRAGCPT